MQPQRIVWAILVLGLVHVTTTDAQDEDYRRWRMRDGRRSRIAMTVVEIDRRIVSLKRQDNGQLVRVVISGLSDEDQAYLAERFPDREPEPVSDDEGRASVPSPTAVRWPAPELTDENLEQWMTFIRPSEQEISWRTNIRWHNNLATAQEEARRLNRPILLWTMNGNPCGET